MQGFYFTKSMQGMATNYPYYHSQTNQAKDIKERKSEAEDWI